MEETPDTMLFYTYLPNEPLSKDRVEAFSDGVYAIVATLLILDIWCVSLCFLELMDIGHTRIFCTHTVLQMAENTKLKTP